MGLLKESWVSDIQKTLEEGAPFLTRARDLSAYLSNKTVHIPQSGAATQIFKNANTFPLTVAQRTDSVLDFTIDQYSTQAFLVTDLESAQLSYDKRNDVMGQHTRKMVEEAGKDILAGWVSSNTVATAAANATTYKDIIKVAKAFDDMLVPKADRNLELSTEAFYQLIQDPAVYQNYISGLNTVTAGTEGVLKIAGINVYGRVNMPANTVGVAYHKDYVGFAKGNIDLLVDSGDNGNGNPLYGGSIMSAIMWLGSTKMYADGKGTITLTR